MAERVVCRLCKFGQRNRPDREKMNSGRVWCICYRKEFNGNQTCPKGETAESSPKGMINKKVAKPVNKNAF